jgi:hypothetical protein
MAHNIQLWTRDFAANLYDQTAFYTIAKNHSEYLKGNIVHIPYASNAVTGGVLTNGTSLPVSAVRSTFSDLTYSPATLYANPTYVTNIDAAEASFDTRSETMKDMVGFLKENFGQYIAIAWSPDVTSTGSIVDSTGTVTRSNIFGNTAIKKLTLADLTNARVTLEKNAKRGDDLYLIVDPFQFADIVEFAGAAMQYTDNSVNVKAYIAEYAGFKIIKRYKGIGYTAAKAAKVAYGAAEANTHLSAALAVSASMLSYAVGTPENGGIMLDVKPYETGYYADVMQGHVRVGASPIYPVVNSTVNGVVAIIESK